MAFDTWRTLLAAATAPAWLESSTVVRRKQRENGTRLSNVRNERVREPQRVVQAREHDLPRPQHILQAATE